MLIIKTKQIHLQLDMHLPKERDGMEESTRHYGKCPKISNTKVSDKMAFANSADLDQTAPEGAFQEQSDLGLHVCHSTKYL